MSIGLSVRSENEIAFKEVCELKPNLVSVFYR